MRLRTTVAGDYNFEKYRAAAVEIARTRGLNAVSFDAVALASRSPKSSIRHYFGNVLELRRVVVYAWDETLRRRVLLATDRAHGLDRIWLMARAFVAVHTTHPFPFELLREAPADDEVLLALREEVLAALRDLRANIAGEVRRAIEDGMVRPDAAPEFLAARILGILTSVSWQSAFLGVKGSRTQVGTELWETVQAWGSDRGRALKPLQEAVRDLLWATSAELIRTGRDGPGELPDVDSPAVAD